MSTGVTPETPSSTPKPEGTSTSPAPATGTSSTPPNSEFRYGADAPEWARGKTAKEVLGLVEQQNTVIKNYISSQPTPQTPYTNQYGSSPGFQQQPPQNNAPQW